MDSLSDFDCPACDGSVRVGLPYRVDEKRLLAEPDPALPDDVRHKTRRVRCSCGQTAYVYFVLCGRRSR